MSNSIRFVRAVKALVVLMILAMKDATGWPIAVVGIAWWLIDDDDGPKMLGGLLALAVRRFTPSSR